MQITAHNKSTTVNSIHLCVNKWRTNKINESKECFHTDQENIISKINNKGNQILLVDLITRFSRITIFGEIQLVTKALIQTVMVFCCVKCLKHSLIITNTLNKLNTLEVSSLWNLLLIFCAEDHHEVLNIRYWRLTHCLRHVNLSQTENKRTEWAELF